MNGSSKARIVSDLGHLARGLGRILVAVLLCVSSPVRSGELPEWLTAESDRVSDSLVTGKLVYAKTLAEAAVLQAAQNYGLINREHAFALMMLAKTLGELQRHQQALESQIRSPEIYEQV